MTQPIVNTPQEGPPEELDTSRALLAATEACLLEHGYAGLSTRKVAKRAGVPLSQIHYHFGSKRNLVLSLFKQHNDRLLERQSAMFGEDLPLWRRWEKACDYLDADLESGYVRVLQELMAAGWSDPEIAAEFRRITKGWYDLLTRVAEEAAGKLGGLGPFSPSEAAVLIGNLFMGCETMILAGFEDEKIPIRPALRKIGMLIRMAEEGNNQRGD